MNLSFSQKIYKCLLGKVIKFNESCDSNVTIEQLIRVYKRGEKTSNIFFSFDNSTAQWAMARVNMFLKLCEGRRTKEKYKFHDLDVLEGTDRTLEQEEADPFWSFSETDFTIARTDLLLGYISDKEAENIFSPQSVDESIL